MEMILMQLLKLLKKRKGDENRPTLIEVKTVIGYGSPNRSGKSAVHGAPLGADELKLTKEAYKWTFEEDFHVPSEVYNHFNETIVQAGSQKEQEWTDLFKNYKEAYPELAESIRSCH